MGEVKYHELSLPSKLIPYKTDGVVKVEIRETKGRDIKLIGELNEVNFEKKFKVLLTQILRGIDPGKLTIGDRIYIVVWLALTCNSRLYPVEVLCEHCFNRDKKYNLDLGLLEKKLLPDDFKEPYPLTLTDGSIVNLRLYRVNDQIQYMDYLEAKGGGDNLLYKLAQTIADDNDLGKRIAWLEDLSTQDIGLIRAFHERFYHGPDFDNAPYKCTACGGTGVMPVPFRLDILLPTGSVVAESLGRSI